MIGNIKNSKTLIEQPLIKLDGGKMLMNEAYMKFWQDKLINHRETVIDKGLVGTNLMSWLLAIHQSFPWIT